MNSNKLINRKMEGAMASAFRFLPVITLTGPRQSGKTTLCRMMFDSLPYVNLEDAATLSEVEFDPKAFLSKYPEGIIIDEAQRCEKIFSYLQVIVDEDRIKGENSKHYIVTGSSNFALMRNVSQSMAGRTAVFTLLPLSVSEILSHFPSATTLELILMGGYPSVWMSGIEGRQILLSNYYTTYIERDLRLFANIKDLSMFHSFVRLCAGRIGSEFNASALAVEVGVSVPTIKAWLSILEASYVVHLLPPYYANIKKRLTKSPKLYFYDTGLASWLLGINSIEQLELHPLKGALFENMVVNDFIKKKTNVGEQPTLFFYRDQRQHEVDLIEVLADSRIKAFEIKSGMTYRTDYFTQLEYLRSVLGDKVCSTQVIYDGNQTSLSNNNGILNYRDMDE